MAEGYFANSPLLLDPGVYFAMHAQLRQELGESYRAETWTTRVEMKETTQLSFTPLRPDLIGTPVRFVLAYRFDGTGSNELGSGVSGSISAEALAAVSTTAPAVRSKPATSIRAAACVKCRLSKASGAGRWWSTPWR